MYFEKIYQYSPSQVNNNNKEDYNCDFTNHFILSLYFHQVYFQLKYLISYKKSVNITGIFQDQTILYITKNRLWLH